MSQTPSKRRREGREAFYFGGDPDKLNPYRCEYQRSDWLEGWEKAAADYNEAPPEPTLEDRVAALEERIKELIND